MNRNSKTVFITGISSDIGLSIAQKYLDNGWNILGQYYKNEKKLKTLDLKQELKFDVFQADFSHEEGIAVALGELKRYEVDVLINNAGSYIQECKFTDLNFDLLVKSFSLNTFTPMMLTSAVFERMKKNKFGRIVNVSSIAAKYGGSAVSMHYGASKRALEGLTKTLAREGAAFDILVNTVRPGVIDTSFHSQTSKDLKKRIDLIPLKKLGMPKDIASITYYLGSDQNNFITNEIIAVAGGE